MVPPSGMSSGPVHRQTVPRTRLRPDLPRKICPSRGADKSPSRKQGPGAHTLAEGTRDPRQGRPASLKAETGHPLGPGSHSLAEGPRDPRQDRPASLEARDGTPSRSGRPTLSPKEPETLVRVNRLPSRRRRDALSGPGAHSLPEGTRDPASRVDRLPSRRRRDAYPVRLGPFPPYGLSSGPVHHQTVPRTRLGPRPPPRI